MNVKGSYSLRAYLVAALFFGAVISLFALGIGSMSVEYNNTSTVDPDFVEKYSRFEEYTDKINEAKESLSSEGGIQVVNIGFGIFQASFAFVQLVLGSFGLIGVPTESFTEDFSMPFQVAAVIFTLATAAIVIMLITRIFSSTTQGRW